MSARTGLAAETCTRELAQEMAAIPALAEALKDSSCVWWPNLNIGAWSLGERNKALGESKLDHNTPVIPAPTVRELLARLTVMGWYTWTTRIAENKFCNRIARWMQSEQYDILDPDALARAVIEAAK